MLGTFGGALFVVVASLAVGGAIVRLSGRRDWSWTAGPVGLAAISILAWWSVRLPGEGAAALIVLAVATMLASGYLWARVEKIGIAARLGALAAAALVLAMILPFAAEGQFGILGTGFNVDMSQHLFAADWLARPLAPEPSLLSQGYPAAPHALAVAASELTASNLGPAFAGVTIAIPILLGLAALSAADSRSKPRAAILALAVGVSYLVATYVAQGSFKEVFSATFLLAFALWLREIAAGRGGEDARAAIPLGVLAAGMLYVYSVPGLAWLIGALGAWALAEFWVRRGKRRPAVLLRRAGPALIAGVLVTLALAAPELPRIADFGGKIDSVADGSDREPRTEAAPLFAASGSTDAGDRSNDEDLEFNDDLGNLFGQISPLTALNVWPTGDFRVKPGNGAVPAPLFYLGSAIALLALGIGLVRWLREDDLAIPAALAAALAIFLAARLVSTPYTTAKALEMIAPLAMLVSVRPLLWPGSLRPSAPLLVGLTFLAGAGVSSALVLTNVPIGPEAYNAGVARLRPETSDRAVLVLVPKTQIARRRATAYYSWELRGARRICVEPSSAEGRFEQPLPSGIDVVLTPGGAREAPFDGLVEAASSHGARLWAPRQPTTGGEASRPVPLPGECDLGLR